MDLQDYEPGKDMGMDWYMWRIVHLVDEVNRLTDLLSSEQAAADHARDVLISEPIFSG
jgi:hypothetical protein